MNKETCEDLRQFHLKRAKEYMNDFRNAKSNSEKRLHKSSVEYELKLAKQFDDWSKEE